MKAFITVIGHDTVGVVAKVAALCSELNINIEDVTQSILQGMFAMIMLVDISHCSVSHEELHNRTDALAKEMGMQINVTRQEVFDAMHTRNTRETGMPADLHIAATSGSSVSFRIASCSRLTPPGLPCSTMRLMTSAP